MKITKEKIHSWEQVHEKDYEKKFDDELIILLEPDETSKEMGDYILECQEKARKYDKIAHDVMDYRIELVEENRELKDINKKLINNIKLIRERMNCKKCHHKINGINCNEQRCRCVCWK